MGCGRPEGYPRLLPDSLAAPPPARNYEWMLVNITIPTFNRSRCITQAVDAALQQSYTSTTVTVIDDGSTDATRDVLLPFFTNPAFCYIRLAENRGTAGAKNASLLLSRYDAITFHDSDDLPDRHKVLLQQRALALRGHIADPMCDWHTTGHVPGSELVVETVFTAHNLIRSDGTFHLINKRISLVDDFFPNVQFPSRTEGDWILVNSALFRREMFRRLGGFLASIEEDRELRNRLIASGTITYFLEQALLDKIEMPDSLTVQASTNYRAETRNEDRRAVWERTELYRRLLFSEQDRPTAEQVKVPIDLQVKIAEISNPGLVQFGQDLPMTEATKAAFARFGSRAAVAELATRS